MTTRRTLTTALACAAALLGGLLVGTTVQAQTSADPSTLPLPVLTTHQDEKVLLVEVEFSGPSTAHLVDATVIRGRAHGRAAEPPFLRLDSVAHDGSVLDTAGSYNPVHAFVVDPVTGAESFVEQSRGRGHFYVPYRTELRRLAVTNREEGVPVGSFDLAPALAEYCAATPTDEDCRTDLRTTLTDAPDPAVAGLPLSWTATVANDGPRPAHGAGLRLDLPSGVSPGALPQGCTASGLEVTCTVGLLTVGAARSFTVPATVAPDLVHQAGAPVTLTATATALNSGAADLQPDDDVSTSSTLVRAEADLAVDALSAAPPAALLIGGPVTVPTTTTVSNGGPSTPMDAAVDRTVTSTSGITASPASPVLSAPALSAGAPQQLAGAVTVQCTAPGDQSVTVTDVVRPDRPDDTDLQPANSTRSTTFTVDCVLPVALSIKPGGSPNPLTGWMPMAVLTTSAGEEGLPLAVDATRVQPLSARFGPESVFDGTGGSAEMHGRGHVEDTTERDQRTRDGDLDMVLHHPRQGSGLAPTDTRGCLRGTYLAPSGALWTFFGCDALRP